MSKIDKKLDELYLYIINYKKENGISPTVRDICKDLTIKSTATAKYYIDKLVDRGLINKQDDKKRALTIKSKNMGESLTVPLIGTITAGTPIFAVENLEGYYQIPSDFQSGSDLFMLKVKGESMINAGILDGDYVLVQKQEDAKNGDMVVALIDDSSTVKTFYKENGYIRLQPENDYMDPIIVEDVMILGKVFGVFRFF